MLRRLLIALVVSAVHTSFARAEDSYVNFETVPLRPLAYVERSGADRLYAVNTPDDRLEVFEVRPDGSLEHLTAVAVGLAPVAVSARSETELWVVNHLSDSVSVVDASVLPPHVTRTLLVGDEPWDVAFAGAREDPGDPFPRAFVSAARRGQNHPENANATLKTEGLPRADVWVFDAASPGDALGGAPLAIVPLFGDKPRPLLASADGSTVWAGIFLSGNQTSVVLEAAVCDGGADREPCDVLNAGANDDPVGGGQPGDIGENGVPILPGGLPPPNADAGGTPGPEVGLIVRFDPGSGRWLDPVGRNWNGAIPFTLPDFDVFAIDASADPPAETRAFSGVGTVIFALAEHPSGRVYVSNTDASNLVRFEGPGTHGTTVRGNLHRARITRLDPDGSVHVRHLNKHIDYGVTPVPADVAERSLATPQQLVFSPSGDELYVAALGSQKVGVFQTAALDDGSFEPDPATHVPLSGAGPSGLALDPTGSTLYVYTRFDNQISVVDVASRSETSVVTLHDAEPAAVTGGRRFLYDARASSSNGEASCAACHVFGDRDGLGWDLGNPSATQVANPNPFTFALEPDPRVYHPLKGPMTTQTLRGMAGHGPLHWRGDRSGASQANPNGAFDVHAGFREFAVAFEGLLGRDEGPIDPADMQAFADFALTIQPPPSPIRELSDDDTPDQANGRQVYSTDTTDGRGSCLLCHALDPAGGFFGGNARMTFDAETQHFKIPHLRNVYDKVGAFGFTAFNSGGNASFDLGPQVSGFGLLHDGGAGGIEDFLSAEAFSFPGPPGNQSDVEDFVLAFPSNFAPAVGQQVTLSASSGPDVDARVDLLADQADDPYDLPGIATTECELVARAQTAGDARGFLLLTEGDDSGKWRDDRGGLMSDEDLRALADTPGQALTFTCAAPGTGQRLALDRDLDGTLDGEQCGDANDDGLVTASDPAALRRHLAALPPTLLSPSKCDVDASAPCDVRDLVILTRALADLPPGIDPTCPGS